MFRKLISIGRIQNSTDVLVTFTTRSFFGGEKTVNVRGSNTVWNYLTGKRCSTELEAWLSERYKSWVWSQVK